MRGNYNTGNLGNRDFNTRKSQCTRETIHEVTAYIMTVHVQRCALEIREKFPK
jgi:hypothetical protein